MSSKRSIKLIHSSKPLCSLGKKNDLALIKLKAPVVDVQPAKIYRKHNEDGQTVWFIGSGGTGTGLTGETVGYEDNNGTLRKARNRVESVSKSDLTFIFDSGDDGVELEGVSGNGDSGGPAFIAVDGEYYVLGVSSRTGSWFKDVGEYGVINLQNDRKGELLKTLRNVELADKLTNHTHKNTAKSVI